MARMHIYASIHTRQLLTSTCKNMARGGVINKALRVGKFVNVPISHPLLPSQILLAFIFYWHDEYRWEEKADLANHLIHLWTLYFDHSKTLAIYLLLRLK